jgi:hypothetical protein
MASNGGTTYPYGPRKRRQGVGQAFNASLGRQLSNRVQNGAITAEAAQHTAYERQVLAKAFGPGWREKVYGKGGAKGIQGPFSLGVIRRKRAAALKRARAKLGGAGEGG